MLCIGHPEDVEESKNEFMRIFKCDDVGEFKEYVGCKITQVEGMIKITQPVLLQSYEDEFNLPTTNFKTPAEPRKILSQIEEG